MALYGHTGTVNCLDLHGDRLVSGSKDRLVKGQSSRTVHIGDGQSGAPVVLRLWSAHSPKDTRLWAKIFLSAISGLPGVFKNLNCFIIFLL